jgi:2-C-methyl-D-erythritol 4-phosphate cytidylyltransferase
VDSSNEPVIGAILAAGGRGLRFGGGAMPKQFLELLGLPIYIWSLRTLLENRRISRAVIVAPEDLVSTISDQVGAYRSKLGDKPVYVVAGGDTRQRSVYQGMRSMSGSSVDYVLIHDAARPFLTGEIVDRTIDGVIKYGACTTGIPPSDTVKTVEGEHVVETLSRDKLVLVQTPQAARYDWLVAAHERAEEAGHATTDDAAILEFAGHRVGIVSGAPYNLKLTHGDDLVLAKALATIVLADRL